MLINERNNFVLYLFGCFTFKIDNPLLFFQHCYFEQHLTTILLAVFTIFSRNSYLIERVIYGKLYTMISLLIWVTILSPRNVNLGGQILDFTQNNCY